MRAPLRHLTIVALSCALGAIHQSHGAAQPAPTPGTLPTITLRFKDASLEVAVAELQKSLGIPLGALPQRPDGFSVVKPNETYSLDVQNAPFWEVFTALSKQHDLRVMYNDGLEIGRCGVPYRFFITGPCLACPAYMIRTTTTSMREPPAPPLIKNRLTLGYHVQLDPRINVVAYENPQVVEVLDTDGKALLKTAPDRPLFQLNNDGGMVQMGREIIFNMPENPKAAIASVKGLLRVLTPIQSRTIDIPGPFADSREIQVGEQVVILKEIQLRPGNLIINAALKNLCWDKSPADALPHALRLSVIDANDTCVWTCQLPCDAHAAWKRDCVPPLKLQISETTATQMLEFPFEIKNLALP
jgi:hypothetical protein